jgi:hypothetical protein
MYGQLASCPYAINHGDADCVHLLLENPTVLIPTNQNGRPTSRPHQILIVSLTVTKAEVPDLHASA